MIVVTITLNLHHYIEYHHNSVTDSGGIDALFTGNKILADRASIILFFSLVIDDPWCMLAGVISKGKAFSCPPDGSRFSRLIRVPLKLLLITYTREAV